MAECWPTNQAGNTVPQKTSNQKGKDEADQVQFTPGTEPGNAENSAVQHQVVTEQNDVAALPGGRQYRRQETADNAQYGQGSRILQHCQGAGSESQRHQQKECQRRGQQMPQLQRGKNGQEQNARATALQTEGIDPGLLAQTPADYDQGHTGRRHRQQTKFQWNDHQFTLDCILEQKRDTKEGNNDPELDRNVAGGKPGSDFCHVRPQFGWPDRRSVALR